MNILENKRYELISDKLKAWQVPENGLSIEAVMLAFTHSSYAIEYQLEHDNQRLEFLGDAVIDIVVAHALYKIYPQESEGFLTKMRAKLVCEKNLAKVALQIGMDQLLLLGNGEELGGGRQRASNLEDCFEAFCGMLYLEKGLDVVEDFIQHTVLKEKPTLQVEELYDYKSMLQEVIQRKPNRKIEYFLIGTKGPDHNKLFHSQVVIDQKKYAAGWGKSKKNSEQVAAKKTLMELGVLENEKGEN